jgi:hypothetical protein
LHIAERLQFRVVPVQVIICLLQVIRLVLVELGRRSVACLNVSAELLLLAVLRIEVLLVIGVRSLVLENWLVVNSCPEFVPCLYICLHELVI